MVRDPNALAPLVLRLALGAIFLYHGLEKVLPPDKTDWGAGWAVPYWEQQSRPPAFVYQKLDELQLSKVSREQVAEVRDALKREFNQGLLPPDTLRMAIVQFVVAWAELLGGLALLLGGLTRVAALALIVIQAGAIYTVTAQQGFSVARGGGYEFNLALVAMCLALVLTGAGPLSLDRLIARRREARSAQAPPAVATGEPVTAGQP